MNRAVPGKHREMGLKLRTGIVLATILLALSTTAAFGAGSKEDFIQKVDPVCKRAQKQANGILNNAGDSSQAMGKAWSSVARKGRDAIADISKIGPPPSNLVLFDRWIQKLQLENAMIVRLGRALKASREKKAEIFEQKATNADKRADKVVRSIGFKYCDRSGIGTP